jgi:lipopolysaccharide/colanic/teichoic acid biosynthesis glycosyltransferase
MNIILSHRREITLLFIGDLLIFLASLWLTLTLRYFAFPGLDLLINHLIPFSLLFVVWLGVFFIAGLYDKHTVLFKKKLPGTIFQAQLFNIALAALFFFFIPYFGITPKTNLVIYLAISFILIVWWRLSVMPLAASMLGSRVREKAILIGSGDEAVELFEEVNGNNRYPYYFSLHIDPNTIESSLDIQAIIIEQVSSGEVSVIVGDGNGREFEALVPLLSNLAFLEAHFHFIDVATLYENIFDRIPLSLVGHSWYLYNISTRPRYIYNAMKRLMDIVAALILGVAGLILLPFVYITIKLEDGGPIFIFQERIGENNRPFRAIKFRSMTGLDVGDEALKSQRVVTRVGNFVRKTRIDEFPQLWNVFKGELSLIGPRAELPALVRQYAERVPNYNVRHLIKPGLTGWAQICHDNHPHHGIDIEATREKLSYDLYYLKNRSIALDIHIALKTAKTLLSRSGR